MRRMRRHGEGGRQLALVALILLGAIAGPVCACQEAPAPLPWFGVIGPAPAALLDDLGVGWSALVFSWPRFYPAGITGGEARSGALPPAFTPDAALVAEVEAAIAAGREVVAVLRDTPPWASPAGDPAAVPAGLALPYDDPGNLWGVFVSEVVRAFAPLGVRHWVIYETPDIGRGEGPVYFAGTVAEYAQLVRVAAQAARAVDPGAVMHLGALMGWVDQAAGRTPYLARLLEVLRADPAAAAQGYYFDVVTVRALNATALVWQQLEQARGILEAVGLRDKAIWLEANAAPTLDAVGGVPGTVPALTPLQQADFLVQAVAIGLAAGAQRVAIYGAGETTAGLPWGLIRADGTHRPAYDVLRRVPGLLREVQSVEAFQHPAATVIWAQTPAQTIALAWARSSTPITLTITAPELGEAAQLFAPGTGPQTIQAGPEGWPGALVIAAPGAVADPFGFLAVAGSPRVVVMERRDDFYRVVSLNAGREQVRLR